MTTEAKKLYMAEYRRKNAEKIATQRKAYSALYRAENREKLRLESRVNYAENRPARLTAMAAYAKANATAIATYQAEYRKENYAAAITRSREWYRVNKVSALEKQKVYSIAHREVNRGATRRWALSNPGKTRIRAALRRHRVRVATPKWADLQAIRDVYLEAIHMQLHVDHIIPLRGKNVCGLHVETNLQLLTPLDNRRKGNSHAS